jgi:hypothetical protein
MSPLRRKHMRKVIVPGLIILAVAVVAGCSKPTTADKKGTVPGKAQDTQATEVAKTGHSHDGWWCDEHGIPEEECSMCSAKFAAECKKKGDWCEKHDRAKSQCFICDPKLKETYAAKYRTKYGKEPPPIEEEKKDEGKVPNKKS